MAFVLSDEEERQTNPKPSTPSSPPPFRRISLKMNEDIVIHNYSNNMKSSQSTRTLSSSHLNPERPILPASHPHLPRADSAIQTDITALKPRQWSSEPVLVKRPSDLGSKHGGKMDYSGRGRYSLLNRDFTPHKSNHRLNLHPTTAMGCESRPSSTFSEESSKWKANYAPMDKDMWESEINSTDKLLFIAEEFVNTARRKLIQIQDWKAIHGRCPQRVLLKNTRGCDDKHRKADILVFSFGLNGIKLCPMAFSLFQISCPLSFRKRLTI